jgi:hypothetical protein
MQIPSLRRGFALLAAASVLAACSRSADNPYAGLKDPPLVQAYLHTVTLVSDDVAIVGQAQKDGYRAIAFATNYPASIAVEADFFQNVLGTGVPRWPATGKLADNVRVQVWTYFVKSVVQANKRLRENGIPVVFDPVAIITPYLGDHKTMAIRAPDGTVIELVEAATN